MKIASLILALTLCSCGGSDDAEREREGAFDDMTGTLDKANEVEQKVLEQKDRIDEALREPEDPDDERDP